MIGATGGDRTLRPLSERILAGLGGSRAAWIVTWALVPWLNAAANVVLETETSAVWEQSDLLVVLNYAAISLAVVLSLWGTGRIAHRLETLQTSMPSIPAGDAREAFRGVNSVAGPLVASAVASLVFGLTALARDGLPAAVLRGTTWFILGIALFSFIWTYASLLLGLNRLGRARLVPNPVHVDPGLGLQPLGAIASTGLWMLVAWLVPILLTSLPDLVGAAIGMLVLVAVLATFFLSLLRLHRQMLEVKASELALARELYAQAYRPVREARTLEVLEEQRSLLAAADALERRASAIHEWPFAERTPTLVITVVTSVIAMTIGRLILDPFGL